MRTSLLAAVAGLVLAVAGAPPALAGTDTASRFLGGSGSTNAPQPALDIGIALPEGVAAEPDGDVLVADKHHDRILRVQTDGTAVVAAGGGADTQSENVAATSVRVNYPTDVAVLPGGGFLYVESLGNRVRRVTPDGKVQTVAGDGSLRTDGDGGAATAAGLYYPWSVAVMPDGGFVVSQPYAYKVRRVGADGKIRTILGNGTQSSPEDVPGTESGSQWPYGVGVMKDGSVLVAEDFGARLRRVRPDGIVERFAGSGTDMPSGISAGDYDGHAATSVGLGRLCDIAVAPDDSVFVSQSDCSIPPYASSTRYYLIGRIKDGKYSVYAGNGFGPGITVEGVHRRQIPLGRTRGLAFTAGGDLLLSENSYYRVWRIDSDIQAPTAPPPPPPPPPPGDEETGDDGQNGDDGQSGDAGGQGAKPIVTPGGTAPSTPGPTPPSPTSTATKLKPPAALSLTSRVLKARRGGKVTVGLRAGAAGPVTVEVRRGRKRMSRVRRSVNAGASKVAFRAPKQRGTYTVRVTLAGGPAQVAKLRVR